MHLDLDSICKIIHEQIPYYAEYNYGKTLTEIVCKYKPNRIYEFGTGTGFTALYLALGCYINKYGTVITHDIFDTSSTGQFTTFQQNTFLDNIQKFTELSPLIQSNILDYNEWLDSNDTNFDLIYFDINNNGDKILDIYKKLNITENSGKILLCEGGHPNRGTKKYQNVTPIHDIKVYDTTNYELIYNNSPGIIKIIL